MNFSEKLKQLNKINNKKYKYTDRLKNTKFSALEDEVIEQLIDMQLPIMIELYNKFIPFQKNIVYFLQINFDIPDNIFMEKLNDKLSNYHIIAKMKTTNKNASTFGKICLHPLSSINKH